MIMSETMLIGLGIVAVSTLAGLIGTLTDTKNKAGLKVFLVLLILGAGGAGVFTEYQREEVAKSEKKRAEEALSMAGESGRIVKDEMLKNELFRQKAASEKEKLLANRKKNIETAQALSDALLGVPEKIAELEEAAAKARKKDIKKIAAAAAAIRAEISKKLFDIASSNRWLSVVETEKMEKVISSEKPLKPKLLDKLSAEIKENLNKDPLVEEKP
jgi:hypothetical protein